MTAEVLNGVVEVGDSVAYATRGGSSLDMNIGVVLEVLEVPHPWRSNGDTINKLRVRTETSTDIYRLPRTVVIGQLYRVVKL